MTKIEGNTYAVKDRLKAMGCRWSAAQKCWIAPTDSIAAEAQAIVKPTKGPGRPARTCKDCGCRINYGVYCGKCEYR